MRGGTLLPLFLAIVARRARSYFARKTGWKRRVEKMARIKNIETGHYRIPLTVDAVRQHARPDHRVRA